MKPENPVIKNDMKRLGEKFQSFLFILILMILLLYIQGRFMTEESMEPIKPSASLNLAGGRELISFEDGDVIFQQIEGSLGDLISDVTESPMNHCGLVMLEGEDVFVLEASDRVTKTPLEEWIRRGRGSRFAVLKPVNLSGSQKVRVVEAAGEFLGRPYDFKYRLDDEYIYCSELVFKAYLKGAGVKISETRKLEEMNIKGHEDSIKKLVEGPIPLKREIITPVRIYNSPFFYRAYSDFNLSGDDEK